jgi:hypothetical protein
MIATSLLYLHSKFELTGMNTCGSAVVRIDVCFDTASQKWRRIISSNIMQSSFVSSWGRALPIPMKRFRKHSVVILYHVLKNFGGTKTL